MIGVQYLGIPSLAALVAIFCFSSGAMASGVVASADESSLVAAMTGGGAVTFAVNGTIYLTNTIVVSNDTVLDATGYKVAISGSNSVRIFIVNTNSSLAMTNLTLENGVSQSTGYPSGGGAISNAGTLEMIGCTFISNSAVGISEPAGVGGEGDGGAVYNTGIATAFACVFSENSAVGGFGGFGEEFELSNGGNAAAGAFFNANDATLVNCSFSNNTAAGGIGGSWNSEANYAGASGGGADGGAFCNSGNLVASNNTFSQNVAIGGLGGLGGSEYFYDYAYQGAAGGAGGASAGGAICCLGGSSILVNDTFWSNSAFGGAGAAGGAGSSMMLGSYGQDANGGNGGQGGNGIGGALFASGGSLVAWNVTVASNSAAAGAGGAGGAGGSGLETISGSPGSPGAAGIGQGDSVGNLGGVLTLKNSILCPNALSDTNIYGGIVDAGNNIDSDMQNSLTNATSLNGVNPGLAPLGNYGGATPTMALLPGSPAIDAADLADFPATDQRGVPRPFGPAPDIGAFESTYSATISGVILGLMQGDQATIILGHEMTLTTNGGGYSFVVDDASFIVTPTNANYVFAPPTQTVNLVSNQTGVNFQAYRLNAIELVRAFDNSVNLAFAGTNGQSFRIEVSTNLSSWTPIATNTIGASGFMNVSFPMTDAGGQYFRLVSP